MSLCPVVSGVYFTKEGNRVQEDPHVRRTHRTHLLASPSVGVRVCVLECYVCVYARTRMQACTHRCCVCRCARMCIAVHTHCILTFTHVPMYMHTCIYVMGVLCVHTYAVYAYICIYMYSHAKHVYVIHVYKHACVYVMYICCVYTPVYARAIFDFFLFFFGHAGRHVRS